MEPLQYYSLRWVERRNGKGIQFMVDVTLTNEWDARWVVKKYTQPESGELMLLRSVECNDRFHAYATAARMMTDYLHDEAERQQENE